MSIVVSSHFLRRAVEKWKQIFGFNTTYKKQTNTTYNNLIGVFKCAGYQGYADTVYTILKLGKLQYSLIQRLDIAVEPPPSERPHLLKVCISRADTQKSVLQPQDNDRVSN